MLISKNKVIQNASKILEEDLKIKLPEDYSKFLDKYNGGSTYDTKVKFGRKKDDITGFYGFGETDGVYSFENLEDYGVIERLSEKKLFPIASNSGGDYYSISLDENNYGEIYLYYHDLLGKKTKVATDFIEFINNSKSEEIGHIKTMEEREKSTIENGYGDEVEMLRPIWKEEIEYFSKIVQEEVIL